jgi:hypothetical protein
MSVTVCWRHIIVAGHDRKSSASEANSAPMASLERAFAVDKGEEVIINSWP